MSFEEFANTLVPFESFDSSVFIGTDEIPQEVCDLVLSLALAYNDYHDVAFAHTLINELGEIPEYPPTTRLGFRNGLRSTIIRVQAGFVHELLDVIRDNEKVIESAPFQRILRKLSSGGRAAWASLFSVAINKPSKDELAQALVIIRNKIAFHYDPRELGRGYAAAFVNQANKRQPLISRGSSLIETRFYFADAAAHTYFVARSQASAADDFFHGTSEFLQTINRALHEIVTRFINSRSAWSSPKADA